MSLLYTRMTYRYTGSGAYLGFSVEPVYFIHVNFAYSIGPTSSDTKYTLPFQPLAGRVTPCVYITKDM